MSRFPRIRRRPDHWADAHERAKARLAERMDGPLGLAESNWLDEHLAGCPSCAAIANAYEDDRLALRALRDQPPEPPRDLWARTAAGLESAGYGQRSASGRNARRSFPIGALSGVMVVAVVVGVSLLSGSLNQRPTQVPTATPDVASGGGEPAASPAPSDQGTPPESTRPSPKTLVGMRASGPRRDSAVAVVNSFMLDANGRCRPGALAQTTSLLSDSTTSSPLAAPPPRVSSPRIWSQAWLAWALPESRKTAAQAAASRNGTRLIAGTNT